MQSDAVPREPTDPLCHDAAAELASGRSRHLLTVGHGTMSADELTGLLTEAGVELVVDVRSAPGSRRHPQFGRAELETWLPSAGVGYRWEPDLGGFRRTSAGSPNVALRHPSFRGYADYMATDRFREALMGLLGDASHQVLSVMCAETLWWRCHRRLIADAATLCFGVEVRHLGHDGRLSAHRLTEGVRVDGPGGVVYDVQPGLAEPGRPTVGIAPPSAPCTGIST
jgi:uncharacterized protein (DUF488 family)